MLLFYCILMFSALTIGNAAIIGYDCTHKNMNITTIALDRIKDCKKNKIDAFKETEIIQLIQLADNYPVKVLQCKIEVTREIKYCGMHSHVSSVAQGLMSYIKDMSGSRCAEIHERQRVFIGDNQIDNLKLNSSATYPITISGTIKPDGTCDGKYYSDNYGSWSNVIVQGYVRITLSDYLATADSNKDIIVLRSGLTCTKSKGFCMDYESGLTTWNDVPQAQCDTRLHVVLYEGPAQVMTKRKGTPEERKNYLVETGTKVFSLRTTGHYKRCGFAAFNTEHPKLVIIPKPGAGFQLVKSDIPVSVMDSLTYMNTKLVYVVKDVDATLERMYDSMESMRCTSEISYIQLLQSIAYSNPKDFAYIYMKSPGYTATQLGEVIHIVSCNPVSVEIRKTPGTCWHEMPVIFQNYSRFLTPRSRLIQREGTQVECDRALAPIFRTGDDQWINMATNWLEKTPIELTPKPMKSWTHISVDDLATSGIYSYEEAEKMRAKIMNPYERGAITNALYRDGIGLEVDSHIKLNRVIDPDFIEKSYTNWFTKIWGWLGKFGSYSAGFFGLWVLFKIVKFILDTVFHCKALYEIFGFSMALLGGIWDSLTTYLINRKTHKNINIHKNIKEEEGLQLNEVSTPNAPEYERVEVQLKDLQNLDEIKINTVPHTSKVQVYPSIVRTSIPKAVNRNRVL